MSDSFRPIRFWDDGDIWTLDENGHIIGGY